MERYDLYQDIAARTQGDIYIGVVGPVRTGKSTFIKKMMDVLVLPNVEDSAAKERMIDELPQSGGGRIIMTTQPRFVPNEAVRIEVAANTNLKVRLVDCVGYMVRGAQGVMDGDTPRMVRTPWFDYDIPFEKAAEVGTRKVIAEHSTIGVLVTTDGSITDIPRSSYIEPEERVVRELKELRKPFIIVLNTTNPNNEDTIKLRNAMAMKYDTPVVLMDVMRMQPQDITTILETVLFEFPIKSVNFDMPKWVQALPEDHWLIRHIINNIASNAANLDRMRDYASLNNLFDNSEYVEPAQLQEIRLGEGNVKFAVNPKPDLFYRILSEECGYPIEDEGHLFLTVIKLVRAEREYSRVAEALRNAREKGYGMVQPDIAELKLEEPEIVKQGNRFGVRLKASAPSLHFIRTDIETEVAPIVGTERQSEELVHYLISQFENDPSQIWNTNIFGKSLNDLVREGLYNKINAMPDEVQGKIQNTLQRIVNDNNTGGILFIVL